MSSSGRHHPPPLIAARSTDKASEIGGNGDGPQTPTGMDPRMPASKPKRTLVESACSACRRRKSRCDGARPTCSRCQTLRTDCQYEAEEGESRWSALRRRNQLLETEKNELRELFRYVQTRPEPEALEIFRLIRMGGYDDVFALLKQIRERDGKISPGFTPTPTLQHSSSSSASGEQRLPPIRAMLEVSSGAPPVPGVTTLGYSPLPAPMTAASSEFARAQSMGSTSNQSRGSRSSAELAWSPTSPP